ncbi:hypothetical protein KCH_12630 [Kitasatospora cheerisanensis KCTC 2395]|uniref:Uncharacterized protein n=1 Tax=Kitasatospora cheerisanensis KCTC 2395 TaxID=1348663 RepID=A0A066Z0A0_9ACTN|nr:hypothetical protein KCH_12630 [Kitasatospora cheerisanensis KCTC 2395]
MQRGAGPGETLRVHTAILLRGAARGQGRRPARCGRSQAPR